MFYELAVKTIKCLTIFVPVHHLIKQQDFFMDKDDGKWQKETEEKQSATCLQMAGGRAHYVKERE